MTVALGILQGALALFHIVLAFLILAVMAEDPCPDRAAVWTRRGILIGAVVGAAYFIGALLP